MSHKKPDMIQWGMQKEQGVITAGRWFTGGLWQINAREMMMMIF